LPQIAAFSRSRSFFTALFEDADPGDQLLLVAN